MTHKSEKGRFTTRKRRETMTPSQQHVRTTSVNILRLDCTATNAYPEMNDILMNYFRTIQTFPGNSSPSGNATGCKQGNRLKEMEKPSQRIQRTERDQQVHMTERKMIWNMLQRNLLFQKKKEAKREMTNTSSIQCVRVWGVWALRQRPLVFRLSKSQHG